MKSIVFSGIVVFLSVIGFAKSNDELKVAQHKKEAAIHQLKATKHFLKEIKTLESVDNQIIVSEEKYWCLIELYGSECESYCLDINDYVSMVKSHDYEYCIDKKALECAVKEQLKCDKCTKRETCKCYRKIKRKCK